MHHSLKKLPSNTHVLPVRSDEEEHSTPTGATADRTFSATVASLNSNANCQADFVIIKGEGRALLARAGNR